MRLRNRYAKIDGWLRSRALTGLEEMDFSYEIEDPLLPYTLPPSAFRFAPTLRVVDIGCCDFPCEMAPSLQFPLLKKLTLYSVAMSEDSLHRLLSGCPVLESLLLQANVGIACLRISSPTLRSIGLSVTPYWGRAQNAIMLQELVIEDAPCLERLLPLSPDSGPATIRVIRAPKLEVLGPLSHGISKLELGTTVFQEMIALSMISSMRTVKILALDSVGPNLDSIVDFLKCFPCLEKLYIVSHLQKNMKNVRSYNSLDAIECLETHLKKVVVKNYHGMRPDVNFAKFFILNAKVLKKMVFRTINNCNDKWVANQHRQLQLDNRASKVALFYFRTDYWTNLTNNEHTHNLWRADPFESHLCR
uniref:FBD domain-containing protein n=1 Tax=Arundo donax TaxID=35708 RepID=A0A0A9DC98_ARUDO